MDTLLLGVSIGATLAIVGDHIWMKHLAKVEAKIKAEVVAAEALKQSAETEIWLDIGKVL